MKQAKDLATYARSKVGTPYFYGCKMSLLTENYMLTMHKLYPKTVTASYMNKAKKKGIVGKICTDCSGLIGDFRGKQIGSAQLYQTAYKRLPIKDVRKFAVGTVLYKPGHVAVYIGVVNGTPMCIEAKGIDYGVVMSKVSETKWTYGLTFSDMEYDYRTAIDGTWKEDTINPYTKPSAVLKKGDKGEGVKWLQWELREAGYDVSFTYNNKQYNSVDIDGSFGKITDAAVRSYQASCKLIVDGKVGKETKKKLEA